MSGELENPKKSIPIGTMSAIGVSLLIYLGLSYWLARSALPDELTRNYHIMIDLAAWGPAVVAGLLGATFSSALSSLVGAPRILQALGVHNILPRAKWFADKSSSGEPRNALYLTGVIVLGVLMLRDLNTIAPLITLFFLLTYTMINVVVLIEQRLKLISFRPTFRVPLGVPLLGTIGCVFAMFIINPIFSLIAVTIVVAIHATLIKRSLNAPFGDVRSGIFIAIAEWAVKRVMNMNASSERVWKANLFFPAEKVGQVDRHYDFLIDLCTPNGFVKLIGLARDDNEAELSADLADYAVRAKNEGIFASWTIITVAEFAKNLSAGIETYGGSFFKPNIVLLRMPPDDERETEIRNVVAICRENKIGVALIHEHEEKRMSRKEKINIWFDNQDGNWDIERDLGKNDLSFLMAYKLKLNWNARLQLVAMVNDEEEKKQAGEYLQHITELGRIPDATQFTVLRSGSGEIPKADLNVFSLPEAFDIKELRKYAEELDTSCLFTMDSGDENALA